MHFATTRGADDVPFGVRVPPGLASTLGLFSPESTSLQIKILVNDIDAFRGEGPPNSCFFFFFFKRAIPGRLKVFKGKGGVDVINCR